MDDLRAVDLCVPIYLNQQIVFDLLAVLEDGFSQLSEIKTSAAESEERRSGVSGGIGLSNVFALLGVSLGGESAKGEAAAQHTEVATRRVHTPTSLFAKLRLLLKQRALLKRIAPDQTTEGLASGDFVEFGAVLRKNPLVELVEAFKQLWEIGRAFEASGGGGGAGKTTSSGGGKGSRQTHHARRGDDAILHQMEAMLQGLTQSGTLELIAEMAESPAMKAVLSAKLDYFGGGNASEIIDGQFRVLGKVVRVVAREAGDPINLLRKTSFGRLDRKMFDELASALADGSAVGVNLPKVVTEIPGPALQLIPIAIFA